MALMKSLKFLSLTLNQDRIDIKVKRFELINKTLS